MTMYVIQDHEGLLHLTHSIAYLPNRWIVLGKFKLEAVTDES